MTFLLMWWETDTIDLYRRKAPLAPIVFDHSPDSALWAIEQKWPLSSNCTNSPGKDLVSPSRTTTRLVQRHPFESIGKEERNAEFLLTLRDFSRGSRSFATSVDSRQG